VQGEMDLHTMMDKKSRAKIDPAFFLKYRVLLLALRRIVLSRVSHLFNVKALAGCNGTTTGATFVLNLSM